jgi:hypothetical protein
MLIYGIDGTTIETVWVDLPPYVLSCDCHLGFQGETCEEIEVCGVCQNDGYCISKVTPGDKFSTDDIEAQTMPPATYFGELCHHTTTRICIFDDLGTNQLYSMNFA